MVKSTKIRRVLNSLRLRLNKVLKIHTISLQITNCLRSLIVRRCRLRPRIHKLNEPFHGLPVASEISQPLLGAYVRQLCYTKKDVRAAWLGEGLPQSSDSRIEPLARWARQHWAMYWSFAKHQLDRPNSGDSLIMDLGCGVGNMAANLALVFPDRRVIGLDLDPVAISVGKRFCRIPNLDLQLQDAFSIEHKSLYEAVYAIDILEHLPAERHFEFVELALEALHPNGLLFVTTPNALDEDDAEYGHIGLLNRHRAVKFFESFKANILDVSFLDNNRLECSDPDEFVIPGRFEDFGKADRNRSHFRFVLTVN